MTITGPRGGEASSKGAGRLVIPLLALAMFINYFDRGNLPTAAPLIKDELHLSSVQLGVLISAFFWTYTPGQVLASWLGERINPYRTLALGLGIWSLATALTGVASGFAALLVLRMLLGLGETASFPCSSKIIAANVPPHRLGGANALIAQGMALGPALGTLAGGLIMAAMGWRFAFLVFGLISALWLAPWLLTMRGARTAGEHADANPGDIPTYRAILARRELWAASLGHFAGNYALYFVISWLPLYLVKVQGYSMAGMAVIAGSAYLFVALGAFLSGWITDRWMAAGATPNLARKTVIVSAQVTVAAGLAVCVFATPHVAIASLYVVALAIGAASPQIFSIAQTLAGPRAAGKWVGIQNCLANVAGMIGPVVTGFLVDDLGGFPAAFGVAAAVVLVGAAGWGLFIPKVAALDWRGSATGTGLRPADGAAVTGP